MNSSTTRSARAAVVTAAAATSVAVSVAGAAPAAAHERWFVENAAGGDWGFFFSPLPLTLTAAAIAVTFAWRLIGRRLPSPELPPLRKLAALAPYAPRLVAAALGATLIGLAVTGDFATPSFSLDRLPLAPAAAVLEGALGLWFLTGRRLRIPAAGVAAMAAVVGVVAGPVALLESAVLVGVAAFVAITAGSDGAQRPGTATPRLRLRPALLALRAGAAISLVTLAFSEKFTNPELAERTLAAYPQLNLPDLLGLPVSQEAFIAFAASVELLLGLLLISGAMPQLVALGAAVPFTATLPLFGLTELIGHLPVYGVLLAILVYGSTSATAPGVAWLPRQRTAVDAARPVSYAALRKTS